MVPNLAVLSNYLYGKKKFLACSSSAIKQVSLPVWEAAFITFVWGVLIGGFVPLESRIFFLKKDLFWNIDHCMILHSKLFLTYLKLFLDFKWL